MFRRRFVTALSALMVLVASGACRAEAEPGAGTVPDEIEAEAPVAPNGDVIDPQMTVDTQRIPGLEAVQQP